MWVERVVGDEHPVVELTLMSEDEAQVVPLMPDSHGRGHGITLVLGSVSHFLFPFPFPLSLSHMPNLGAPAGSAKWKGSQQ